MRQRLRHLCEIGLSLGLLIWSVACSSASSQTSVEPSCMKRSQLPPEVRAGPHCKEIEAPVLIECVDPDYPRDVWRQRIEGKVVAEATLSSDAGLLDFKVVSSPSEVLSKLALEAFKRWRYKPAFCKDSGRSVQTKITMTTTFSLR